MNRLRKQPSIEAKS